MKYRIRAARPADLSEIIALCAEHAPFEQVEYCADGKAEKLGAQLFSDTPRLLCLLAENTDGEALGYATFMPEFSTWQAEFFLHMDCLFLRPHARNFGIGEALIKAIAAHAPALGCSQIQWQPPTFNERAITFYRRLGAAEKAKLRFYLSVPHRETHEKI
jgi:GNAT superfamily N-acetyltransferase